MTSIPIMVTGGFKTREEAVLAIERGAADAIGLARSMALNPSLAQAWLGSIQSSDPKFPRFDQHIPGGVTAWASMRLTALGEDRDHAFDQSLEEAVLSYEARDAQRCALWLQRFGVNALIY